MTIGVPSPNPILQFSLNNGQLASNGSILTTIGGLNAPTYQDVGLTEALPNPIPLNSRGEVSNAQGASCQLFLVPNQTYTFTLFDANGNQIWSAPYVNGVQVSFTQSVIGIALNPQTPAEAAAGVTPVNYAIPSHASNGTIFLERYYNGTDAGVGFNLAIKVAMQTVGSGRYGIPIRFLPGTAYTFNTPPNWGALGVNIVPIEVYGPGAQLICNFPASSGAFFPMDTYNGWYLHDLLLTGNSANKNDGIHAGNVAATEAIEWRIERVISLMPGVGFKLQNTNTGTLRDCMHWPGNNPALIVPQTVNITDISHGLWMTGGFVHNVSVYDFICNPNSNYNPLNVGILIDAAASYGVTLIRPLVESGSGNNNEIGIKAVSSGSIQSLTMIAVYNEGTQVVLGNVGQSMVGGCTDGTILGVFQLNAGTRENIFVGLNQASVLITDPSAWGNTFIGSIARAAFSDATEANSLSFQPNRYISCTLNNGTSTVQVADLGSNWRKLLAYSPSMTVDTWSGNTQVIRVANGSAFSISMAHPRNGQDVRIILRNESGGVMGAITWSGIDTPTSVPLPANGFNRSYVVQYDSDFSIWHMVLWSPADIVN